MQAAVAGIDRRFQEWEQAGFFEALWARALADYDADRLTPSLGVIGTGSKASIHRSVGVGLSGRGVEMTS